MTQGATFGVTPLGGGAVRPEKRVTTRSKLPQKKCTGLALPMKRMRNPFNTRLACTRACQNRHTYFFVVLCVRPILLEGDRVLDFAGHGPDLHVDVETAQSLHECGIEIGDRHGLERQLFSAAVACLNAKLVFGEIEDNIEGTPAMGHRRRHESA